MAYISGFCNPVCADPGQTIEFRVSSTSESFTATILRFRNADINSVEAADICAGNELIEEPLMPSIILPSTLQPDRSPNESCMDWDLSFALIITNEWKSGMYAVKCVDTDDWVFYIVFIVNPNPERRNRILVLSNTNTWNAYNDMGGFSRYEAPPELMDADGTYSFAFDRPNPNLINPYIPDGEGSVFSSRDTDHNVPFQSRHLARGEMWFLNWLEATGYEFDVTSDMDWHWGVADVNTYDVIVIHTHPEYWTVRMMENLRAYLDNGGNLLYLGGNGLFDAVEISEDGKFMKVFGDLNHIPVVKRTHLFRNIGLPESYILGVRYIEPNIGPAFGNPYTVVSSHPFFDGVMGNDGSILHNGSLIGTRGWNIPLYANDLEKGGASGWEVDTIDYGNMPETNGPFQTLARDLSSYNENATGAEMIYYDHSGGGFVFSTGSLKFCGSVIGDSSLQQVLKNALNASLLSNFRMQELAMDAFRHRMQAANNSGFAAGFPNFYEAIYGRDHVGGAFFIDAAAVEWRDVPLAELNVSLNDFVGRMKAAHSYAIRNGFAGGFPTFFHADYGNGIVCGHILLHYASATSRLIRLSDLGNIDPNDFGALFRAVSDYSVNQFYAGGFPTLINEKVPIFSIVTGGTRWVTECMVVLLKPGIAEWRDVLIYQDP